MNRGQSNNFNLEFSCYCYFLPTPSKWFIFQEMLAFWCVSQLSVCYSSLSSWFSFWGLFLVLFFFFLFISSSLLFYLLGERKVVPVTYMKCWKEKAVGGWFASMAFNSVAHLSLLAALQVFLVNCYFQFWSLASGAQLNYRRCLPFLLCNFQGFNTAIFLLLSCHITYQVQQTEVNINKICCLFVKVSRDQNLHASS